MAFLLFPEISGPARQESRQSCQWSKKVGCDRIEGAKATELTGRVSFWNVPGKTGNAGPPHPADKLVSFRRKRATRICERSKSHEIQERRKKTARHVGVEFFARQKRTGTGSRPFGAISTGFALWSMTFEKYGKFINGIDGNFNENRRFFHVRRALFLPVSTVKQTANARSTSLPEKIACRKELEKEYRKTWNTFSST
jgi:hypothetical protein